MSGVSRREFLYAGLAAGAALTARGDILSAAEPAVSGKSLYQDLLDVAAGFERQRRQRFAAVSGPGELESLQNDLRQAFLQLIGGLPSRAGDPAARVTGRIQANGYQIEKLVFESMPGYFVSACLYRPTNVVGRLPAIVSLCGHSPLAKANPPYQILNANLARRGFIVLACDPVGQGERSQFWNVDKGALPFGLTCGEHAVLGNPMYLMGASLARYEIWDGMRAIDYLISLADVDATKIGCVGVSGGGTQTAYLTALDRRVAAAVICCYITTLPRRMANRIEADPGADPEQDVFGFVSGGIDHAGLLALMAPRPVLLATAEFDFFPIEGARESFAEARRLYGVLGQAECIERIETAEKHGLSQQMREPAYAWFDRWLGGRSEAVAHEDPSETPRPTEELLVGASGQVNIDFRSTPLTALAWDELRRNAPAKPKSLLEVLNLDAGSADPQIDAIAPLTDARQTLALLVNGNETGDWRDERGVVDELSRLGAAVVIVDPRGVGPGKYRSAKFRRGRDYTDPLVGVEENLAYNAFLVGKTLLGMRVADVLAALRKTTTGVKPRRVVVCGRKDAALTALFAAAVEPLIAAVALEEMLGSFASLFSVEGRPINAASIVPGLLRDFGDIDAVMAAMGSRRVLISGAASKMAALGDQTRSVEGRYTSEPKILIDWIKE